jgi:pectin methylesterase-like acyl-CoA thioesterase
MVGTIEVVITSQASVVEVTATPEPTPAPGSVTVCASGCDFTTIQAAIDDAYTISGSIINVVDAVYTEADITVNKDATIRGQGTNVSIVQAHEEIGNATGRVFFVVEDITVTIEEMAIRHGRPDMEPHMNERER